ncbi:hypothetical protein Forpe1208_v012402 [Fusarium oxysporum f. sp. rapae]|uniref:Uncharacterized protein n=1 Tax=Fusarium oxysporum f. sp. rapae TaxID=485398 RepID=A0A8J5NWB5_FUSOX|nr:hypothetical protein Forpe1208_v012402 [Fusarium oxysporum f. sp. rapae]
MKGPVSGIQWLSTTAVLIWYSRTPNVSESTAGKPEGGLANTNRHVHFGEVLNHRHSTKDRRNSNSASARRPVEKLQQEADLRLRPRIAEANAEIASRPAALYRRAEVMNPYSREDPAKELPGSTSEERAQHARLRRRMQPNPGLTVSASRWRPDEKGGYRHE